MFKKLVVLLDILFLPVVYIFKLDDVVLLLGSLTLAVLNSILIFRKNRHMKSAESLVNMLILNVIIWFILINLIDKSKQTFFISGIGYFLFLFSVSSVLAFILQLISKVIELKNYQLVFNFFVTLFMISVSILLYRSNTVNNAMLTSSISRLKMIEDRFGGAANLHCRESETVKRIKKSVVRVIGGEGEGSGFVVNDEGYLLTNFHVIELEPAPKIMYSDNTFETPEILYADKGADLAILKVGKKLPAIDWGNSDSVSQTDEILALGFPFGSEIAGDVTVKKGSLSAKRILKDAGGLEYLQIDSTLNPGMSGGPLINVCGEFVGINTAGTSGLGMAISSNSFKQKYLEMQESKEPLKDISKIVFEPDKSPRHTVEAFYNYIKLRKLEKAFELLGSNFTEGMTFENWKKGYAPNMDTSLLKIEEDKEKENYINIKLTTKDLVGDEIIGKYFEGWWEVKMVDGHLLLWQPRIREVKNPDWLWFYE